MTSVNAERRPTVTSYGAEVKTVKAIFEGSCSRAETPLPSRSNSDVTANVVESVSKESAVSSAGVVEVARGPGVQARADGPSRHSGSGTGHLRTSMTGELTNATHSAFPGAGDPAQSTPPTAATTASDEGAVRLPVVNAGRRRWESRRLPSQVLSQGPYSLRTGAACCAARRRFWRTNRPRPAPKRAIPPKASSRPSPIKPVDELAAGPAPAGTAGCSEISAG